MVSSMVRIKIKYWLGSIKEENSQDNSAMKTAQSKKRTRFYTDGDYEFISQFQKNSN